MKRVPVLVLLLTALASCGPPGEASVDPRVWKRRADELFASAQAAGKTAGVPDQFAEAARAYRNAFRLEDPFRGPVEDRALLAFRIARSFAKSIHADEQHPWSESRAREALLWFDQVIALQPAMRQVWFERARLFDTALVTVSDPAAARRAYQRYLDGLGDLASVSDAERPRVEHARKRVQALDAATED